MSPIGTYVDKDKATAVHPAARIYCIQFSPCGEWLASGNSRGFVDIYSTSEIDLISSFHFASAILSIA